MNKRVFEDQQDPILVGPGHTWTFGFTRERLCSLDTVWIVFPDSWITLEFGVLNCQATPPGPEKLVEVEFKVGCCVMVGDPGKSRFVVRPHEQISLKVTNKSDVALNLFPYIRGFEIGSKAEDMALEIEDDINDPWTGQVPDPIYLIEEEDPPINGWGPVVPRRTVVSVCLTYISASRYLSANKHRKLTIRAIEGWDNRDWLWLRSLPAETAVLEGEKWRSSGYSESGTRWPPPLALVSPKKQP